MTNKHDITERNWPSRLHSYFITALFLATCDMTRKKSLLIPVHQSGRKDEHLELSWQYRLTHEVKNNTCAGNQAVKYLNSYHKT